MVDGVELEASVVPGVAAATAFALSRGWRFLVAMIGLLGAFGHRVVGFALLAGRRWLLRGAKQPEYARLGLHRLSCRATVRIPKVAVVVRQRCWQTAASGRIGDGYVSTKQRRRKGKNYSTVDPTTGSVYHRSEDQMGQSACAAPPPTATNGKVIFRETEARPGLGKRSADVWTDWAAAAAHDGAPTCSYRSIGKS